MASQKKMVKKLIKTAEDAGWRVDDRGQKILLYPADQTLTAVTIHRTSSDARWMDNARGDLRRRGLDI